MALDIFNREVDPGCIVAYSFIPSAAAQRILGSGLYPIIKIGKVLKVNHRTSRVLIKSVVKKGKDARNSVECVVLDRQMVSDDFGYLLDEIKT